MSGFLIGSSGGGSSTPSGPAGGDLSSTYPNPTVAKINGSTVPAGGSLTTGNVLQVTGAGALSYAAVNLAGGANFVTGTLPTGNQASQAMGGDVSGTTAAATVIKINGSTVPAGGALTTGNVLQVTGAGALSYAALNLAGGANFVTGTLPAGNQAAQTVGGDLSGTTTSATVIKISGSSPIAITPANLQWTTGTTTPSLSQANNTTNSATATTLTIQAQNATGTTATGGGLTLTSGTGTTAAGALLLQTGGTTRLTANATGVITIANLGTGVVHADSSGNLTSTTIVNADVAAAAAIAVSKLAAGTSAQVLINNATPTPTWTTFSGDVTVGATGTTTVAAISGASPIAITPANLQWATATTSPLLSQADNASAGATGQTLTVQAQNATGSGTTTGGALKLQSGAGGSGTPTKGAIQLFAGATQVGSLAQASTDFISLGVSPVAAAGLIRAPNNVAVLNIRNAGNTADAITMSVTNLNTFSVTSTAAILFTAATSFNILGNTQNYQDSGGTARLAWTMNTTDITHVYGASQTSTTFKYNDSTTAATGANFTVNSQNTSAASGTGGALNLTAGNGTGTTATGGDVVLNPGTGTSTNGLVKFGTNALVVATGGTSQPTLGTAAIGGTNQPATATQNGWLKVKDSSGASFWIPAWK